MRLFKAKIPLFSFILKSDQIVDLQIITSYKQPGTNKGKWLAYQKKDIADVVLLRNLITGEEKRFDSISDFSFDDVGKTLLLKARNAREKEELKWVDLETNKTTAFWAESTDIVQKIGSYTFDKSGSQFAFIVRTKVDSNEEKFPLVL